MKLYRKVKFFSVNQSGITAIEYGLIAFALAAFVVSILYGNPNGLILATMDKFQQLTQTVASAVLSLN